MCKILHWLREDEKKENVFKSPVLGDRRSSLGEIRHDILVKYVKRFLNKNQIKLYFSIKIYPLNATSVVITFHTLIEQWRVKNNSKPGNPKNSVENCLFQRVFIFYQAPEP